MNSRAPYSPPLPARKPRALSEPHISVMTIRTRKFFGTIALLVLVVVWSLLGMTVAQTPWLANSRMAAGHFLCGCRHRLGIAGDAHHQLDGEGRRLALFVEVFSGPRRTAGFVFFNRRAGNREHRARQ